MKKWMQPLLASLNKKETSIFNCVFVVLVIFRIWLISGIPMLFIYGIHDELFFAKAAHYIIHNQWMGPYNQMTLIKAPFYSFFMALSFFTGLPLFINETIFFITACILLFFVFTPLIENRWWRLLLFTVVLYCPASLITYTNIRIYREFVYFSVTLYVVSFSIGVFLRLNRKISVLFLWSTGLGLSMGAFMITREEGVWIYPILFLLLLSCLLCIWLRKVDQKIKRSFLILLPILLWQIPGFITSSLNYYHYDFFGVTEQLDPDFNRVLSTLSRIKTNGKWHPAIKITKEARMKAYEASPILYEMKDAIESAVINKWNIYDDISMAYKPDWYLSQYSNGGSEIGAHFLWLFRDVVYDKGYYASGKYPHQFYKQLADQLESACNNGKLDCSPTQKIPLIGEIDRRYYPIILRMFFEGGVRLLRLDYTEMVSLDINKWPNWPKNNDEFKYFEEFAYNSINGPGIRSGLYPQYSINEQTDMRLKILFYKEKMMVQIYNIYKGITAAVFIAGFSAWIFLSISKRRRESQEQYLIVSLFLIGLFFSRLMTLAVVDATTSIGGIYFYGSSNYLFIYIFSFLMLNWMFKYKIYRKQVEV